MEAVKNLTLEAGLVETSPDVRAAPRRHLVVFEDSTRGRRFLKTLPPGELFRPSWLKRAEDYWAFLVSAEPEHRHRFSRVCETLDHRHDFTLRFNLRFRVCVPRLLVESRDRDPLNELEDRAALRVVAVVSRLSWEVIWEGGAKLEDAIRQPVADELGMRRPIVEALNTFAKSFGLEVIALKVERALPETAKAPDGYSLRIDRELEDKEDQLRLKEQEQRHETRLEKQKIREERDLVAERHQLALDKQLSNIELKTRDGLETVIQSLEGMLTRAGGRVQTFPEMRRAVRELQEVRDQLMALAQPLTLPGAGASGASVAELPAAEDAILEAELTTSGEVGPWRLLGELRDNFSLLPTEARRSIVPAALHLIAEASSDATDGTEELSERRRAVLAALDAHLDDLDDEQNAWLRRLTDLDWLRKQVEVG